MYLGQFNHCFFLSQRGCEGKTGQVVGRWGRWRVNLIDASFSGFLTQTSRWPKSFSFLTPLWFQGWIPQSIIDKALSGTQFEYIANIRARARVLRAGQLLDSTVASCSDMAEGAPPTPWLPWPGSNLKTRLAILNHYSQMSASEYQNALSWPELGLNLWKLSCCDERVYIFSGWKYICEAWSMLSCASVIKEVKHTKCCWCSLCCDCLWLLNNIHAELQQWYVKPFFLKPREAHQTYSVNLTSPSEMEVYHSDTRNIIGHKWPREMIWTKGITT